MTEKGKFCLKRNVFPPSGQHYDSLSGLPLLKKAEETLFLFDKHKIAKIESVPARIGQ